MIKVATDCLLRPAFHSSLHTTPCSMGKVRSAKKRSRFNPLARPAQDGAMEVESEESPESKPLSAHQHRCGLGVCASRRSFLQPC